MQHAISGCFGAQANAIGVLETEITVGKGKKVQHMGAVLVMKTLPILLIRIARVGSWVPPTTR